MKKSMKKTVLGAIRAHSMTFILFEALPIAGCLLMRYFFDGTLYTNIELPAVIDVLYYLVIRLLPLLHTFIFFLFPLVGCFSLGNILWTAVNEYLIGTNKADIAQKVKEARHYYPLWIIYLIIFHILLSVAAYIAFSNITVEIDGRDISFVCQITFIVSLVLQLYTIIRNIFPVSPEKKLGKSVCRYCQCVTKLKYDSKKIEDAKYDRVDGTPYYTTEKVGEIVRTDTGDTVADVYGEVAHDTYDAVEVSQAVYEHRCSCSVCGHTETRTTHRETLTRKEKKEIENKFYS